MRLFIVANLRKPNVQAAIEELIQFVQSRATVTGVDTECERSLERADNPFPDASTSDFRVREAVGV